MPALASVPIKVLGIDLDEQPRSLDVEARYRHVLLVPRVRGSVLGQFLISAPKDSNPLALQSAVEQALGNELWRNLTRLAITRAIRGVHHPPDSPQPSTSVVVEARGGSADLARCMESLDSLRTPPAEILVVDGPQNDGLERLCLDRDVTYLGGQSSTARSLTGQAILAAQGELMAFVDGASEVDPGWLDDLDRPFRDPLVMAVTGYVGPAELETPAQCDLEERRGLERRVEPRIHGGASFELDPGSTNPVQAAWRIGSGANAILRRAFLLASGLDFGGRMGLAAPSTRELHTFYRIFEGGYRIAFDPARIVWFHCPRSSELARKATKTAAAQASAFALRCALADREPDALLMATRLLVGSPPKKPASVDVGPVSASYRHLPGSARLRLKAARGAAAGVRRARRGVNGSVRAPSMEVLYGRFDTPGPREARRPVSLSPEAPPDLAVLVASFNRREELLGLLRGLGRQTYPVSRFEVTVVIDGSDDGSTEAVRSLEVPYRLTVIEQDHRGVGAARNEAARNSSAPILLSVDDDMVPEPQFLEEHAQAHETRDPRLVAIGYCPAAVAGKELWEQMARAWWEDHYRRLAEEDHQWTWSEFLVGNASLPRSLFEACGGLDETFRRRNIDREFGVRLAKAGARFVYRPKARAWHYFETSFPASLGDLRRTGLYDVLLIQKHPHLARRVFISALLRPDGTLRSKPALAYRLSPLGELLLSPSVRVAGLLERLRMRTAWYKLTEEVRAIAYLLGMKDAIVSGAQLPGGNRDHRPAEAEVLRAKLEEAGSLSISPWGLEPQVELSFRGEPLAELPAIRLGRVWTWDDLIERATAECVGPLRGTLTLGELQRLTASAALDDETFSTA